MTEAPIPRRRGHRLLRLLERLLLVAGLAGLGYYSWATVEAKLYQAYENRQLDAILASAPASPERPVTRVPLAPGSVMGRIEIARLGVSAVVRTGSDARTLQLAVGHVPGTAYPGEAGNVGLAGHRDTFFRRLSDVQPDDEIVMTTAEGRFIYRVERTDVVQPSDVWVLDPTPHPTLTLVTCYPFTYLGSAPERFIVRAVGVRS
jgi:sortase A